MNIYHVSQKVVYGYDTYSDFVIAAESEDEARNTNPDGEPLESKDVFADWAGLEDKDKIKVKLLGIANEGVKGIICSSYHAG